MTLTPRSFRVRMEYNRWIIRLYADMTCGDCIERRGPYSTYDEAEQAGKATGLPDGDKAL